MKTKQSRWLFVGIALTVGTILFGLQAVLAKSNKKQPPPARLVQPVKGDPSGWVADRVGQGHDVYLSANYLFQVAKLRGQTAQMDCEEGSLYPVLVKTMDGMKDIGLKGEALVFVEMARKLLSPEADCDPEVAGEVEQRMAGFDKDPGNTPRGHYTKSEDLTRYFRGVQFLSRAVFDVKINKEWFAQRLHMLFPLEACLQLVTALSDPKNKSVLDGLTQAHAFYDRLAGPPDFPTFQDLITMQRKLNSNEILAYAREKQLPRINKDMGVGVQCLGERFTYHQGVIDAFADKLLKDETNLTRERIFQVLKFRNILSGSKTTGNRGILSFQADQSSPQPSYYELSLIALTKIPEAKTSDEAKNAVGAGLTALAEQTILVTKQTTVVPKSAGPAESSKKPINIYVQPGIEQFLKSLSQAQEQLSAACETPYPKEAYNELVKASRSNKPVKSNSPQGEEILTLVARLPLNPSVTADIFRFAGRSDKGFLQWAIGPFEVEYHLANKAKATGLEMVFFEGWHDSARKGADDPMTNEAWQEIFGRGQYKQFQSLLKVP